MGVAGRKISRNMIVGENCYKIQHRWCLTPVRLTKIFPDSLDKCWQYGAERAGLNADLVGVR